MRERRARHGLSNLSDTPEEYQIQVIDNSDNSIKRTVITSTNSYTYETSDQTLDFSAVQSTIYVKVAQISATYGVGTLTEKTELTAKYLEPSPIITSFTPMSALPSTTITVTGDYLAGVTSLTINNIEQNNLAVIDNQTIKFAIAPQTPSGLILVTNDGGKVFSINPLIVELNNAGSLAGTFKELTISTQQLADGQSEDLDLDLPAISTLREITLSNDSRMRLFGTLSTRTQDTADSLTQLTEASGLILDKLIANNYLFARGILAQNCDDPIKDKIYARIFNNSGSSNAINVAIKYFAIANVSKISNIEYLSEVDGGGLLGAWGIKYSSNYTGKALTAYRADNSSSQDIDWDGLVPSKAQLTSFLAGNKGTINTLFDASGNGLDFSQNTDSKKPSCSDAAGNLLQSNNFLTIQGDGINDNLERNLLTNSSTDLSIFLVIDIVSTSAKGCFFHTGKDFGAALGQGLSTFDNSGNNLIGVHENEEWISTGYLLGTGIKLIQLVYNSQSQPSYYVDSNLVYSSTQTINNIISGNSSLLGYDTGNYQRFSNIKLLAALIYTTDKTTNLANIRTYLANLYNTGLS